MLKDATMAVELDDTYVKAFVAVGEALVELGKQDFGSFTQIDKGIQRLRKGYSLCTGQKLRRFEEDILKQILKAQKIKFYKQKEVEDNEKASMMHDLKKKMSTYKDLMNVQYPNNPQTDNPNDTYKNFAKYLDSDRDARPLEVPDYLKCPITDELMDEPVVIQSGHTYEKEMIMKHFKTNGGFDPITR